MEQNEPLSKNQKKKQKAKEKKQGAEETKEKKEEAEETKEEHSKPSKKAGKRGGAAAAAALKRRREAEQEEEELKQEEERLRLLAIEEEKQRLEDERRKKEEEDRRIAEIREKKRLGLLKSPEQLEAERREAEARKRFIEAGMVHVTDGPKKANELPSSKKKGKKQVEAEPHPVEEEPVAAPVPVIELTPIVDSEVIDDWETHAEDREPTILPPQPTPASELPPPKPEPVEERKGREDEDPAPLYKSPVLCIMGHVDTGKTKLLDKLRKTNVQLGEAGGITQQIGATFFPSTTLQQMTKKLAGVLDIDVKIPGLLIIDTPGHESFSNLRSRGSSLCNLAILVVDIMHGLENQTLESIDMLLKRKIPFIVAMNKIDRIYEWEIHSNAPFRVTFEQQQDHAKSEFRKRFADASLEFAEKRHLNIALYYENPDLDSYISVVPTSAITGEGIPDLISMIVWTMQTRQPDQIIYKEELQATVLEVKVTEGHGTTIDIIFANGTIREGDTIVLYGLNGPIVTQVRALLTPMPLREMRVKGEYEHHKYLRGSCGLKISAQNLEGALAGSPLLVVSDDPDEIAMACQTITADISAVFKSVDKTGEGVYVMASTVGALEALLEYMRTSKVPVSGVNIGPVFKKDVMTAQNQIENGYKKEYATILAFDVKVTPEAAEYAEKIGVKVFTADIIYHLTDQFYKYVEEMRLVRRAEEGKAAVFPCILKIVPEAIFRVKDPIVLGVDVLSGVLKIGTPLCVPDKGNLQIGKVTSIELNHKPLQEVRPGSGSVAIKIEPTTNESANVAAGRHFDENNQLASWLTRQSIDALKEYYMDDMAKDDWKIVKALKTTYGIV